MPTDDLICSYDLAGTATTAATAWTRNGTPLMTLYMPCEGGQANALLDYSGNGYSGVMGAGVMWSATGGHDGNGALISMELRCRDRHGRHHADRWPIPKCAWVYWRQGEQHNNIISGDTESCFLERLPARAFILPQGTTMAGTIG